MSEVRKILACIDLSEFSGSILDYAAEVAWRKEAEIIVYNIINQRDIDKVEEIREYWFLYSVGSSKKSITPAQYIETEKKRRSDELKKLVEKHFAQSEATVSIQIDTGFPHKAIIKVAEMENVDLIVMGNKGRGNFTDTVLGSTALRVLRRSTVPVLNVR
ncbi:MAG: universal stress protein [Desulfobacterales bacterium]|nr:MAG: universal stress protein [Desulfobacterales bacterium]